MAASAVIFRGGKVLHLIIDCFALAEIEVFGKIAVYKFVMFFLHFFCFHTLFEFHFRQR